MRVDVLALTVALVALLLAYRGEAPLEVAAPEPLTIQVVQHECRDAKKEKWRRIRRLRDREKREVLWRKPRGWTVLDLDLDVVEHHARDIPWCAGPTPGERVGVPDE